MKFKNEKLTLNRASEILNIKKKSLKRQLEREVIPGSKDDNGHWFVYLWDILYYKDKRGIGDEVPEGSLTVTDTANCLGISRQEVQNMIYSKELSGALVCHTWYILRSSFNRVFEKKLKIIRCPGHVEECRGKVKILNTNGIYVDEAVEIIRWLKSYPCHSMIIYKKDDNGYEKHEIQNCLTIVLLRIFGGETINIRITGVAAHLMMKEFKQMNTTLFRLNP